MLREITFNAKRKTNLDVIHNNCPKTKNAIVNGKGGRIKFTKEFMHLNLMTNYLTNDTIDALS